MTIEIKWDTELDNTVIVVFHTGWTWANYHIAGDVLLAYPQNVNAPADARIDQIVDFREVKALPTDSVGLLEIKKENEKMHPSPYNTPRNGGITIYVGNPRFIASMLRTFGLKAYRHEIKTHATLTFDEAREQIRKHRRGEKL